MKRNKGWTYAKHLLSHERTNIADVNRSKRELERLSASPRPKAWDRRGADAVRFRDQIALLEVDIVALEMLVLRVLSAEKSGKNSPRHRGPAQDQGQRDPATLCRADDAGRRPFSHALHRRGHGSRLAGQLPGGVVANAPLASTYFNLRKTTIYGGSNEVQRNIVAQTVLG